MSVILSWRILGLLQLFVRFGSHCAPPRHHRFHGVALVSLRTARLWIGATSARYRDPVNESGDRVPLGIHSPNHGEPRVIADVPALAIEPNADERPRGNNALSQESIEHLK